MLVILIMIFSYDVCAADKTTRRYFPKFLFRPPPSTHEEKVIHWNLCRTWHDLSLHYNKRGGIEIEKLCQTCGISPNLGSSPCPTPVRRNVESFFCSNIYILCLLTCLLASLPDEGEEFFKINFSVPISVYLAKQPSHLCVQSKVVKRFRQGWKYIPEGKVFLLRHLLIRRRREKQVCARTWSFKSLVSIYSLISF